MYRLSHVIYFQAENFTRIVKLRLYGFEILNHIFIYTRKVKDVIVIENLNEYNTDQYKPSSACCFFFLLFLCCLEEEKIAPYKKIQKLSYCPYKV